MVTERNLKFAFLDRSSTE